MPFVRMVSVMVALAVPGTGAASDLLGSRRGGSVQWDFCYGKPDSTLLPVDPRTLVQPGISTGKVVHFNAYWKNCHVDPVAVKEVGAAKTCGELRSRYTHGEGLLTNGHPGVGALFTGTDYTVPEAAFGIATFSAAQYNELWRVWGFPFRPDNFDTLVAQR